ncbi:hypothetical protein [Streptomyces flaveolus]|uniref:hypothetical protein n=1 Tax=Streptomyces flaveolus TaxID=67297 RepID=UPI003F53F287
MMQHLDTEVDDLAAGTARAVAEGAAPHPEAEGVPRRIEQHAYVVLGLVLREGQLGAPGSVDERLGLVRQ